MKIINVIMALNAWRHVKVSTQRSTILIINDVLLAMMMKIVVVVIIHLQKINNENAK